MATDSSTKLWMEGDELKKRRLLTFGKKAELIERLSQDNVEAADSASQVSKKSEDDARAGNGRDENQAQAGEDFGNKAEKIRIEIKFGIGNVEVGEFENECEVNNVSRVNIKPHEHFTPSRSNISPDLKLIQAMLAPPAQLTSFSGEPLEYWSFVQAFNNTVDNTILDDSAKLIRTWPMNCKAVVKHWQQWTASTRSTIRRLFRIVEILPNYLRSRWLREVRKVKERYSRAPSVDDLLRFVQESVREANDPVYGKLCHGSSIQRENTIKILNYNTYTNFKNLNCLLCPTEYHTLFKCAVFKSKSVKDRFNFVKQFKLCFNCLSSEHLVYNCKSNWVCNINNCGKRRTKFLHFDSDYKIVSSLKDSDSGNPVSDTNYNINASVFNNQNFTTVSNRVALPIVAVKIKGTNTIGVNTVCTNALLDTGSTSSFCSRGLFSRIGVAGKKTKLCLTTLGQANSLIETDLLVLKYVVLMKMSLLLYQLFIAKIISLLILVELLIGQDSFGALIPLEVAKGTPNEPYVTRTSLGLVLNGLLGSKEIDDHYCSRNFIINTESQQSLNDQIEQFWKVDDVESLDTIRMDIPFDSDSPKFPYNYNRVKCRLMSLKKRLMFDGNLKQLYCDGMDDLLKLGYAEIVPEKKTVHENLYVDDCLVSTSVEHEAAALAHDLIELSSFGGFSLSKFIFDNSNDDRPIFIDLTESPTASPQKKKGVLAVNQGNRARLKINWQEPEETVADVKEKSHGTYADREEICMIFDEEQVNQAMSRSSSTESDFVGLEDDVVESYYGVTNNCQLCVENQRDLARVMYLSSYYQRSIQPANSDQLVSTFVVNTDGVKNIHDLRADDLGVWVHGGIPKSVHKVAISEGDVIVRSLSKVEKGCTSCSDCTQDMQMKTLTNVSCTR
ncbi:hypothetical protein GQR58_015618 [Nymphon striatum]|nr:hypothetical protein GQR58_015618 [Nymphon striatum]